MTLTQIANTLSLSVYDFLRDNKNIVLLGLGGSYSYGTNIDTSDIDIRGIATNTKENILTNRDFEQYVDKNTDTTIYSFDKIIKLFCKCNPNTIELLGLKPEHYFYISPIGQMILDNKNLFLSKRAIASFGGYANSQLRRLENKVAREVDQTYHEYNILKSIESAEYDFKEKYFDKPDDAIKLYMDVSNQEDFDSEIFMDVNLTHYPLRDYVGMWSEMNNIVKDYAKIGKRNRNAIEHNKIGKHMMHLVRLYLMVFDILEKGEIRTYRKEHDFLMSIRNGEYLGEDKKPTKEFYEILDELDNRLEYDKVHTELPETVDMDKVYKFVCEVNGQICNK